MPKCITATMGTEPKGYGSIHVLRGYGAVSADPSGAGLISALSGSGYMVATPSGMGYITCSLDYIPLTAFSDMIKVANTDTTHNLAPDTLTKVPVMGSTPITNGIGGTNFTVNSVDDDVTCNFTGIVGITANLYGVGSNSGLQFKMKVFIDAVEQNEVALSHPGFENGMSGDFPLLMFSVTSGQKVSIRTVKNTFSGTVTIGAAGSCYMTLVKL